MCSQEGLPARQFRNLIPYFEESHNAYFFQYDMNGKYWNNRQGFDIYKNSPLATVKDRLFFTLVYLKNNLLQEYYAACFETDQKHCNCFIRVLYRILKQCLHDTDIMPAERQKEFGIILKRLSERGADVVLLHEGAECEISRPLDPDLQQENYSGKKKKHAAKNAIVITTCCLILFVSESVNWKTHDKKIADTAYSFPYPCILYQNTGYQGYKPEGVCTMQLVKKIKGKLLILEQKNYNRKNSSFIVRVEHVIASTKRMRIVKKECRLRADNLVGKIFRTCAAPHNFRIKTNPWHY